MLEASTNHRVPLPEVWLENFYEALIPKLDNETKWRSLLNILVINDSFFAVSHRQDSCVIHLVSLITKLDSILISKTPTVYPLISRLVSAKAHGIGFRTTWTQISTPFWRKWAVGVTLSGIIAQ